MTTAREILGLNLEPADLTFIQISLRGVIVFVVALVMIRLADKRFLGKMSAFDAILGFILASMLARVINGSGAFFPTLGAGFVLVGLHRLMAVIAFKSKRFARLVKGEAETLVQDGKLCREQMRANSITIDDIAEEARLNGNLEEIRKIKKATIERNGHVSILPIE